MRPGIGRGALAVEVALQAVADRFVQQHAGPAVAEHHRHRAGRRIDRVEVHQRLAQGLAGERLRLVVGQQVRVRITPAEAGEAGFAASVLLHDDLDVHPHQRAHIAGQHAVAARDQHGVHAAAQAHHHLLHARIQRAHQRIHAPQQRDLGLVGERIDRIQRGIQLASVAARQRLPGMLATIARDRPRRLRGREQRRRIEVIRIREAGLLAGDRAHAHALLDRMRAVLDDAVLHAPALAPRMLEIQVAEVDARAQQVANARCSASVSRPAGASKRDSAMASAFMGPASECVATR
jgi:hypothetical protein